MPQRSTRATPARNAAAIEAPKHWPKERGMALAARCPLRIAPSRRSQRQPRLWWLALRHSDHGTARLEPTPGGHAKGGGCSLLMLSYFL
jgi:hypothetical protein